MLQPANRLALEELHRKKEGLELAIKNVEEKSFSRADEDLRKIAVSLASCSRMVQDAKYNIQLSNMVLKNLQEVLKDLNTNMKDIYTP
mmetsp:Transcript_12206/g.15166  ORF Transcript_12206/g.15166 Transcript_12206/m.15166 type:complete len:88 (-) Transcript_12206:439-702(-)